MKNRTTTILGITALSLLALTGCNNDEQQPPAPSPAKVSAEKADETTPGDQIKAEEFKPKEVEVPAEVLDGFSEAHQESLVPEAHKVAVMGDSLTDLQKADADLERFEAAFRAMTAETMTKEVQDGVIKDLKDEDGTSILASWTEGDSVEVDGVTYTLDESKPWGFGYSEPVIENHPTDLTSVLYGQKVRYAVPVLDENGGEHQLSTVATRSYTLTPGWKDGQWLVSGYHTDAKTPYEILNGAL